MEGCKGRNVLEESVRPAGRIGYPQQEGLVLWRLSRVFFVPRFLFLGAQTVKHKWADGRKSGAGQTSNMCAHLQLHLIQLHSIGLGVFTNFTP